MTKPYPAAHPKSAVHPTTAVPTAASTTKLKQLSRHRSTNVRVNNYIHTVDIFRDHCLPALL